MRILHLVHQYMPENVGGTELYTRWLTQALSQREHQIYILYRRSAKGIGKEARTEGNVNVWAAWTGFVSPIRRFLNTFYDPPMVSFWEQFLYEVAPDLVHIQHLMGLPFSLATVLKRRRIPYLITLHDYWWVCANAQLITNYDQTICDGPRGYWNCARCALARMDKRELFPMGPFFSILLAWRNRLARQVLDSAAYIITPTRFVADWYARHGVSSKIMRVIPHGLPAPTKPIQKVMGDDRPIRFAYVGGLSWQKGVHVLLDAFSRVRGDAELWIAGDESFDPDYVARLRELATPNVRFLGLLSREAVWDTLAQVDVVTVPTLWYETFSFIVSEAFAAGLPVLASRLGPLADRVRDGVDGLLLPPGDVSAWRAALQRLVDEPDLVARLRSNVRPPVTLEEHVDQVEALYSQILKENPHTIETR